jgi:lysophospholipase L1-like esterase
MTIFIAGDSTAARKESEARPETGWGEKIAEFLAPGTAVRNCAVNGRSSKSFIDEGRLDSIAAELRSGDVLLIQFGHNDEKDDPARGTDAATTYKDYLSRYIAIAREAGATPVLLTPVARRKFNDDGSFRESHGTYPAAMKELAAAEGVPLLDLHALTTRMLIDLGPEASKALFLWLEPGEHPNYPEGSKDDTHFNDYGARVVAGMAAEEFRHAVEEVLNYT